MPQHPRLSTLIASEEGLDPLFTARFLWLHHLGFDHVKRHCGPDAVRNIEICDLNGRKALYLSDAVQRADSGVAHVLDRKGDVVHPLSIRGLLPEQEDPASDRSTV